MNTGSEQRFVYLPLLLIMFIRFDGKNIRPADDTRSAFDAVLIIMFKTTWQTALNLNLAPDRNNLKFTPEICKF